MRNRASQPTSSPSAAPAGSPAVPDSPRARRQQPRRWLDPRILLGLLLVIASVVVGARVLSAADDSITVWAVTTDLAAGSQLRAGDVEQVTVRMDANASSYLGDERSPIGQTITRDLSAGELIPVAAIADAQQDVAMALSVPTDAVPATVRRGQRINVYATDAKAPDGVSTTLVAPAVTVEDVVTAGSGALNVSINTVQVVILVPECAVEQVLEQTADRSLAVVVVSGSQTDALSC